MVHFVNPSVLENGWERGRHLDADRKDAVSRQISVPGQ
jgi:hypothetical protein